VVPLIPPCAPQGDPWAGRGEAQGPSRVATGTGRASATATMEGMTHDNPAAEPGPQDAGPSGPGAGRGGGGRGSAGRPGPGSGPRTGATASGAWGSDEAAARRKLLTRSRRMKVVGGVCGGLGRYFGIDPVIFRVVLGLLALTGGVGLI